MGKKLLFALLLLLAADYALAQESSEKLTAFNQDRLRITRAGMLTLGSWAVGNMLVSGVASRNTTGSTRYFHQMNVYWNVVNLTLAGFGYYGATKADPAAFDVYATLKEQYGMEKILLLNAGLDVAYLAGGLYLLERGKHAEKRPEMLRGFGRSVIVQGAFLLLFDSAFFGVHNGHGKQLKAILDNVTFTGSTAGVVLHF